MSISQLRERFDMSTATPQERVRQQVAGELIPKIAELIYQCDKGSKLAVLADLRSEDARAVYKAEALMVLSPEARHERMARVHAADAHQHARLDDEQETVARQARADVAIFGDPLLAKFMRTNPQTCPLCGDRLLTNAVDVLLTASGDLKGRAHGLCCAKDERRFVFVSEFTYQLIGRKDVAHDPRD